MAGRRADPAKRKEAEALLRSGVSVIEVFDRTGITRTSLYRWAKELGIATTKNYPAERPTARKFDRQAVAAMLQTHPVAEVSQHFGCSTSYAYACLDGRPPVPPHHLPDPSVLSGSMSPRELCDYAAQLLSAASSAVDKSKRADAKAIAAALAAAERARDRLD